MRKVLILLLIFILLVPNLAFASEAASADSTNDYLMITESQTWGESKTIDKNLIIAPNVVLTISSGVQITLNADFIIYGQVKNNGSLNLNGHDVYANYVNMGGIKLTGDSNYSQFGVFDPYGRTTNVGDLQVKPNLYPAPPIRYNLPADQIISSKSFTLSGETVPGFKVKIAGNESIAQANGTFEVPLSLTEGENTLTVSIVDVFQQEIPLAPLTLQVIPNDNGDSTATIVTGTEPQNNAENISVTQLIHLTFNEPIFAGPNYQQIKVEDVNGQSASANVNINNNVLSITPATTWNYDMNYRVVIPVSSVVNEAGLGNSELLTLNFTTAKQLVEEVNPPTKPIVSTIYELETSVTGTTDIGTTVIVQIGAESWSTNQTGDGKFNVTIPAQQAGTEVRVKARDTAGRESEEVLLYVQEQPGSEGGTQLEGRIDRDTIWTKENSPYILVGHIQITNGAKLTLEPGVKVENGGDYSINLVSGTLESTGQPSSRISFEDTSIYFGDSANGYRGTVNLQYNHFDGGSIVNYGSGNQTIKDSIINGYISLSSWDSDTGSIIERNIFKNAASLSLDGNKNNIVRNNFFYSGYNQSNQSINYQGGSGQTIIEYNSFMSGGSANTFIRLGDSAQGLNATNNFWNTTDEAVIEKKIYDRKDRPDSTGDEVVYKPYLTAHHPNTPLFDVLMLNETSPEHNGAGAPLTSDITLTFNQDIQLNESAYNEIYIYPEGTASPITLNNRVEGKQVILTPVQPLLPNTRYYVNIPREAVQSSSGRTLDNSLSFSFLTGTDQGVQISGKIEQDTIWTKANSPYILVGHIQITNGAKLTIEPGVKVENGGDYSINLVSGTLESIGQPSSRINFEDTSIYFGDSANGYRGTVNLQYTDFDGGSIVNYGSGNQTIKDSIINGYISLSSWDSDTGSIIERNIFKNAASLSLDGNKNNIVRNNFFYSGYNQSNQSINYQGGSGQTIIEYNSFMSGGSANTFIRLGDSAQGLNATNNFWNTTDEAVIEKKIYDRKDRPDSTGDEVVYKPYLTAHHPNTPLFDVLMLNETSPEHNGAGAPLTSDITLTFNQDIQLNESAYNEIYIYPEGTASPITLNNRVEGKQVILTPVQPLLPNTRYYVNIPREAVQSSSGRTLDNSLSFSFLTGTDQGVQISGKIEQDTIWTKANSPYILVGHIQITNGAKLTIEPGVKVENGGDYSINLVSGTLESIGQPSSRINFEDTSIYFGDSANGYRGTVNLQYTDFDGGSIVNYGSGNQTIKDSVINGYISLSSWDSDTGSIIERNIFMNAASLSLDGNKNNIVRNNFFYSGYNQSNQSINYQGGRGQTIIEYNSFMSGGSANIFIRLGDSAQGLNATNNFWNTTDEAVIEKKIYDRKDRPDSTGDELVYKPYLTTHHRNTPLFDVLMLNETSPEHNSYGISLNTDITLTFNQDINFNESEYNKIYIYPEGTASPIPINQRIDRNQVILTPLQPLLPNTKYYVNIPTESVQSAEGLTLDNAASFSFLTGTKLNESIESVGLTKDLETIHIGDSVSFTATSQGSSNPNYQFWVKEGNTWRLAQNYGTANTFTYTASNEGTYYVSVYARDSNSAERFEAIKTISLNVKSKVTTVDLTRNLPKPRVGETITYTANAKGSNHPSYQFWVREGSSWRIAQDYSQSNTFTYTPSKEGTLFVSVYAKDSTSTERYEAYKMDTVTVNGMVTAVDLAKTVDTSKIGESITFTASAKGSSNPSYQFWIYEGGVWRIIQDYSTLNTFTYTPSKEGTYYVAVYARDSSSSERYEAIKNINFAVRGKVTQVELNQSTTSLAIGESITYTANAKGSSNPRYQFWVNEGGVWRIAQDYGQSNIFTYTPSKEGTAYVSVYARDSGSTDRYEAVKTISSLVRGKVESVEVSQSTTTPIVGESITFTASAKGSSHSVYQFWVNEGGTWRIAQNYSTTNTFTFTPAKKGTYYVSVYAKDAGSTEKYEAVTVQRIMINQ
jgi:hypothetical protein